MKSSSTYKSFLAFFARGDEEKITINAKSQNTAIFNNKLKKKEINLIQEEIGESIWFGFNIFIDPNYSKKRTKLSEALDENGNEYRPILEGNFLNKYAVKFFINEIPGQFFKVEYMDKIGLFISSSNFNLNKMISPLSKINFQ